MNKFISAISACRRGATALEFALLAPALLLLTVGLIEGGLLLGEVHRYGHAARAAARAAATQPMIARAATVVAGPVTCTGSGGSVSCSSGTAANPGSFAPILAAARTVVPTLADGNLRVTYRDSAALGGIAAGLVVTPTITVEFTGLQYESFFLAQTVSGVSHQLALPTFATTAMGPSTVN